MAEYDINLITTGKLTPAEKQSLTNAVTDQIERKVKQYDVYLTKSGLDASSIIHGKAIVLREGLIAPLVAIHFTDEKLDTTAMEDKEIVALYETAKAAEETYNGFDANEAITKTLISKIAK
ncbi:MAG: hypothetical protein K8953_12640 [Proteobacteria bacterium]|nr:hypothetical protein [Pseudomonadota bacterium]